MGPRVGLRVEPNIALPPGCVDVAVDVAVNVAGQMYGLGLVTTSARRSALFLAYTDTATPVNDGPVPGYEQP